MTVEELLLSFDVIPQKIICIGAKEKPFESEYAEIVCDYGEYEVADFRYTSLSKIKTIHIWVKPTINKGLKN